MLSVSRRQQQHVCSSVHSASILSPPVGADDDPMSCQFSVSASDLLPEVPSPWKARDLPNANVATEEL